MDEDKNKKTRKNLLLSLVLISLLISILNIWALTTFVLNPKEITIKKPPLTTGQVALEIINPFLKANQTNLPST